VYRGFSLKADVARSVTDSSAFGKGVGRAIARAPIPSPALCERRHRRLPRRLISVSRAFDVAVVAARPHPGSVRQGDLRLENAAHDDAVLQNAVVLLVLTNRIARLRISGVAIVARSTATAS